VEQDGKVLTAKIAEYDPATSRDKQSFIEMERFRPTITPPVIVLTIQSVAANCSISKVLVRTEL
jgi:hypothetical protein